MKNAENTYTHNILIEVDVQNDFVSGSLAVEGGEQVIDPLNQLAKAVRATLGRVALTRDWHPATTPHFETWPVHCVADTDGAEFDSSLDIQDGDLILSKGMGQTDGYSGIEAIGNRGATIEQMIENRNNQIDKIRVFIGGLATDYCVKATAIDLSKRFSDEPLVDIYAVTDAMRAVNLEPQDGEQAIEHMRDAGVKITNLDEALTIINQTLLEK